MVRLKVKETNLKNKTKSAYYSKSNLFRISNLKSPSTYRQFYRYYLNKSSSFNIPRKLRRKIRNYFFYESIKYIVLFYPLIPKAKKFIKLRSRYLSILRSDRKKSRNRDKNDRPKQKDKKIRFEKDNKNKDNKRDDRRKKNKIYIINSDTSEC